MRDRDSWLHTTMIALAGTAQGEFDESVYVSDFAVRMAEPLAPARVCVLLLTNSGEAPLLSEESGGDSEDATEVCSVLPMRSSGETIGLVRVLSPRGHVVPAADLRLTRMLTDLAAITIARQRELLESQRLTRQLQHALDSRIIIEQAKGALSAWLGITPGDAFGLLRSYARARSRPLARLAGDVVAGTVPAAALLAGGRNRGDGRARADAGRARGANAVRPALPLPSAARPRPRCRPAECRSPRR